MQFAKQGLLHVPELWRKVNVITVGVLKPLNLVPKGFNLAKAILAYLGDMRGIVNPLSVLVDGYEKLS